MAETPSDNLYLQNLPLDMTEDTITQIFGAVGYRVVQCKVMPPRQPGGTTCVAMVRFASLDEAKFVLESFNGTQLPGFEKPLHISYAGKAGAASGFAPGSGPAALAAALAAAVAGGCGGAAGFGAAGGAAGFGAAGGPFGIGYGKAPVASMMSQQVAMQPYMAPKIEPKVPGQSDNLYIKGLPAAADESFVKQLFDQYGTVRTCKVLKKNEGDPRHALVRFSSVEEATTIINTLNGGMLEGFTTPLEITYAVEKTLANLGGPNSIGGMGSMGGGCGGTGDPNVEQMLDEWVKAKRMRDFATADSIRAVLRSQGVDPDHARPVSTDAMLDEWVKAKRMRDFTTADALRVQLRAQGVDPDTARPGTLGM
eukprot:TRINITY_DN7686_c0_g1_i1.p1 TRINITY_DN7686_c0_g1~~TRINITY_DN7686_c0_g1_i1.p1  ORF type:complete len:382 (+),score=77.33 TRINITY_DN7686_c0_g1_i1:48-1148(+)